MLLKVYLAGLFMVLLQGLFAYADGYFTERQINRVHNRTGWSICQHLGIYADATFVAFTVAYIISHYPLPYLTAGGIICGVGALAITYAAVKLWEMGGRDTPEAHTHDGKTTVAGWVNAVFMAGVIWVMLMFYFCLTDPPEMLDVIWVSISLTWLFVLGVMKWSSRWHWSKPVMIQVASEIALVWAAALWTILH